MLCIDNPTVAAAFMTAHAADLERFGPPDAEFDIWCKLDAWTVEEAVALSMGREPFAISPQVIKNLGLIPHKHGVKTSEDLQRLSRIAGAYEARHRALLRAARHAKLPAKLIDGAYEITPLDFLAWFERPRGEAPWQVLPVAMVERVEGVSRSGISTGNPWHCRCQRDRGAGHREGKGRPFFPRCSQRQKGRC